MHLSPNERVDLGKRRIVNVLRRHGIATIRMLEQKIADAGPNPQRVDPHLLTISRTQLQAEGRLRTRNGLNGREWHYLPWADAAMVEQRFQELQELHSRTESRNFTLRMGQAAEIAVLKALQSANAHFIGHFDDLDDHDDSTLYNKHDPDVVSGKAIKGGRLDYVMFDPQGGPLGLEVKNTREWIYPDRSIVKDLLTKCIQIDAVPVLIARRISYSTFSVMSECGLVIHRFYNQLYPNADADLAHQVKQKLALGYFDVRVGNEPDARMLRFFRQSLRDVAKTAREKFDDKKDAIKEFTSGQLTYAEFTAQVRGRYDATREPDPE